MSKADLIKNVAAETGCSQQQVSNMLNATLGAIQSCVANGETLTLVGFGTFYPTKRKASTGRNPRTGDPIQIKAATLPKFRAGKKFKDAVNDN